MPRYYCDYCDTYLTHDSPSVRKQHNSGYKHKVNIRDYYQQFEAQQNQSLIDQRIKEHLGQAALGQGGVPFNVAMMMRPRLPILPTPNMPIMNMPGINPNLIPGMGPPVLPRPPPVYNQIPGAPPMMGPPGPAPYSGQFNGLPEPPPVPMGGGPTGTNGPPTMYQQQPTSSAPPNMNSFDLNHSQPSEASNS